MIKEIVDLFDDVIETKDISVPEKCYNVDEKVYDTTCFLKANQVDKGKFRLAIITKSNLIRKKII